MKHQVLKENLPYKHINLKPLIHLGLLILGLLLGMIGYKNIDSFFNTNVIKSRSPIIIQMPIYLEKVNNGPSEQELQRRIQELEASVSALKVTPSPTPYYYNNIYYPPSAKPRTDSSVKTKVLNAIAKAFGPEEVYAAEVLITKESNFNPLAQNKKSSACGIFQATPCSKLKCDLSDVDCQISWGINYIKNRYGTPTQALNHWLAQVPINGRNVGHWY